MRVTASNLRANIYRLLDRVLNTGVPLIIERRGRRLRISAEEPPSRLDALPRRTNVINGDPEDLVHVDWSGEWRP